MYTISHARIPQVTPTQTLPWTPPVSEPKCHSEHEDGLLDSGLDQAPNDTPQDEGQGQMWRDQR